MGGAGMKRNTKDTLIDIAAIGYFLTFAAIVLVFGILYGMKLGGN
jgi:hypothetical protein